MDTLSTLTIHSPIPAPRVSLSLCVATQHGTSSPHGPPLLQDSSQVLHMETFSNDIETKVHDWRMRPDLNSRSRAIGASAIATPGAPRVRDRN